MELSIYDRQGRYEKAKQKVKKSKISKENKELIFEFDQHIATVDDLSILRREKYMCILSKDVEYLRKSFKEATEEDIKRVVMTIRNHPTWAPNTKKDYQVLLKRFYKWLSGDDEEYLRIVKWIKIKDENKVKITTDDLLTPEELERILSFSESARDRAFLHVLAESGTRIGEIGTMRRRDVVFDKYGAIINVDGKTGQRQYRRMSFCRLVKRRCLIFVEVVN